MAKRPCTRTCGSYRSYLRNRVIKWLRNYPIFNRRKRDMIAGSPAIDASYESLCDPGHWEMQFYWPERVWRWVRVSRLQWGRADAPADPNAALQPDRTLFRRGARQMVNVYGLEGQDAAATEMHPAIAHLRDSGEWMTAGDLAAWAGIKPGSMAGIIAKYRKQLDAWPQEVHRAGRAYRVTYYRWKRGGQ